MLTPVVRILLILNGLVFVAQIVAARPLMLWLALWPIGLFGPEDGAFPFQPWQILTYAFLHGGIAHPALNMYALWMFSTRLEYRWGSRTFRAFYLACVAGAAFTQLRESEIALARGGAAYPVLGASGGVFGVLLVQIMDLIESYREMASSMIEVYLSTVSNRLNESMRVLAVIATLFIPLTFIVGIYGMNFDNMPELGWDYGYPAVWLLMIAVAAGMIYLYLPQEVVLVRQARSEMPWVRRSALVSAA